MMPKIHETDPTMIGSDAHGYAIKFCFGAPGEAPTDDNLRRVLAECALRPPTHIYPDIRAHVERMFPTAVER